MQGSDECNCRGRRVLKKVMAVKIIEKSEAVQNTHGTIVNKNRADYSHPCSKITLAFLDDACFGIGRAVRGSTLDAAVELFRHHADEMTNVFLGWRIQPAFRKASTLYIYMPLVCSGHDLYIQHNKRRIRVRRQCDIAMSSERRREGREESVSCIRRRWTLPSW